MIQFLLLFAFTAKSFNCKFKQGFGEEKIDQ